MTNVEFRKLGGPGPGGAVNLPSKFLERLKWSAGEYLVVELDELRHEIVLRKAPYKVAQA